MVVTVSQFCISASPDILMQSTLMVLTVLPVAHFLSLSDSDDTASRVSVAVLIRTRNTFTGTVGRFMAIIKSLKDS